MWKYYLIMFAVLVGVLWYTYEADPCNRLLRTDFARQNPAYELLSSEAHSGSPESVHCQISYRKPGDEGVYEATWLYGFQDKGWRFSRVVETEKPKQASE